MITRIEMRGFKGFLDFTVDLTSFQIIAGPNAVGKSNFFDGLELLSLLAERDFRFAFDKLRGDPLDQFTRGDDGQVDEMRFAVEALVPRAVRDKWGEDAVLPSTYLRYELGLALRRTPDGRPQVQLRHEHLQRIGKRDGRSRLRPEVLALAEPEFLWWGNRGEPFISTVDAGKIVLHQDGRAGRKREFQPREAEGTVLSSVNSVTFRHAFAMRETLRGIRFLHFEHSALRSPSPKSPFATRATLDAQGGGLAAVLGRLEADDPRILGDIARQLRSVVRNVRAVDVLDDEANQQLVARVAFDRSEPFPAGLLSDGTLRLLALATLSEDPEHGGIVCFEEPENGIHPQRMAGLLSVLRGLSSQPADSGRSTLRQLIVNTHSPVLVSLSRIDELLFAQSRSVLVPKAGGLIRATTFRRVVDESGVCPASHPHRSQIEPP